ncbi:hypothetical protein [Streptomyces liliifuscus]|uniref:Uncharacterized protein n=1 Tax=Streptomyces liliifuscus TaxID=2797636 RepID=A0A7T7L1X6_9ACTN|nr:hypothetical protein [Streptomyces liliifuscus]QQM44905.1 hypothetical protein JEQ17_39545 [Streptomyces liliifuscus]
MPGTLSTPRGPDRPGATNPDPDAEITACACSRTPALAGTALTWDFIVLLPTAGHPGALAAVTAGRAVAVHLAGARSLRRRDA